MFCLRKFAPSGHEKLIFTCPGGPESVSVAGVEREAGDRDLESCDRGPISPLETHSKLKIACLTSAQQYICPAVLAAREERRTSSEETGKRS